MTTRRPGASRWRVEGDSTHVPTRPSRLNRRFPDALLDFRRLVAGRIALLLKTSNDVKQEDN